MSNEDLGQETRPAGRIFHVTAHGDTADELELNALDQAREFFGPDRRLEILPDYQVSECCYPEDRETGKKYVAGLKIRAVENPRAS